MRLLFVFLSFLAVSSSGAGERSFESTFSDLLKVFERDLNARELPIRNDVSFRNVEVKGQIPGSFREHLKARLTEAFLRSHIAVTPVSKIKHLGRVVDTALYLDTQKLVLSLSIQDPETGTLLKQLNYDSEELKAGTAGFLLNKNSAKVEIGERVMQYPPSILYGLKISYISLPDLSTRLSSKEFGIRVLERFSSRRYELGFDLSTLLGSGSATDSTYRGITAQSVFLLGRSFIGNFEDYDRLRWVGYIGFGGYYANGLLGSVVRAGADLRIGKSFAIHSSVGYRPRATGLISSESRAVKGVEFGLGLVAQFETYGIRP